MMESHENYTKFDNDYLDFHQVSDWAKDNKYIKSYYRKTNENWKYYFKSIFKWHNETINIWTHLLGFFGVLCSNIYINIYYDVGKYKSQDFCINIFTCCMMFCYLFSSIMHLFYPKNEKICSKTQFLDYTGINILIASTFATFIYYAFYCERTIQIIYYSIILSISIIILPISKMKIFLMNKYRWIRPTVFTIYGSSFIVPIIHRITLIEKDDTIFHLELEYFIIAGIMYIIGLILYTTRFPENYWNGKFDLIGSSHQIFHIFVLLGGGISLIGSIKSMNRANNIVC